MIDVDGAPFVRVRGKTYYCILSTEKMDPQFSMNVFTAWKQQEPASSLCVFVCQLTAMDAKPL